MNKNSSLTAPGNGLFIRSWHKSIPPKAAHEKLGLYSGSWSIQMDRYWESNDGFAVSSRQIRTAWGTVEHVAINRMNGDSRDVPWAIKQQIKDELFGSRRVAIEVYPSQKNLIDTCDVYHLWVLPKDFVLPFGIHPTRDPQGKPVERGYDFSLEDAVAWTESEERKQLIGNSSAEEKFIQLFCDVFGPERGQYVYMQYPFVDIYGGHRTIDFALNSDEGRIAIEVDGNQWHQPGIVSEDKYHDDLLKQNSLVHEGWRVYRWTSRQLDRTPDRIKDP